VVVGEALVQEGCVGGVLAKVSRSLTVPLVVHVRYYKYIVMLFRLTNALAIC
jgi:hypothetical protein